MALHLVSVDANSPAQRLGLTAGTTLIAIDGNELADALGNIWDVAHLTVRDIRQHLGLTQAAFAERFCIPRRTVENWERKGGHIPQYNILAYADITGMLKVVRDEGGNTK